MATVHATSGALVSGPATIAVGPPAQQLLDRARSLHRGLEALVPLGAAHANAAVFLASWSLELALKAHLAANGQGKRELRSIQHNLEALWVKAAGLGLSVPTLAPRWCTLLSKTHDDPYHQRYPSNAAASTAPNLGEVVVELGKLLQVVHKAVV